MKSETKTQGSSLEFTDKEEEASFVIIIEQLKMFVGVNLDITLNKMYEVKRKFYDENPYVSFLNGEVYIINDIGKELYGFPLMCKLQWYK
ncbi:hypothetical protein F4V43_01890 [Paenibacillus spiritus]|uniref:Uncharacterized protein n=1 Tax=Paenibacillus spiritus TaxID=2496557 RepID=A0A5J5GHS2_9BACL|nr:hypothetical protein [Paenibacillus spiritus]KAA9007262.1 hypothetical protein F4V43_01890 [Paenibacillus spiritus]